MKKNLTAPHMPCPCQSSQPYGECCGVWHHGIDEGVHAPTPEALMRSRYSAYVLGLLDYLLKTWHPAMAPGDLELFPTKWLGLEVISAASTGDAGVVEFVARCKVNGKAERMHETSRFVRVHDALGERWVYIDGDQHAD